MGYEWPLSPTVRSRFDEKVRLAGTEDDDCCWLWTAFTNPSGYGMIRNGRMMALAHRVAWALANGPIPDGKHVLHRCDVPRCVNPSHLYIGTNADNMADKVSRGRSSYPRPDRLGEKHPLAKLSAEQVEEIRRLPFTYGSGRELAKRFGVTPSNITHIRQRKLWKHI